MPLDLQPFLTWVVAELEPELRAGSVGVYGRKAAGAVDLYGLADVAVALWSIDRLPSDDRWRTNWCRATAEFQDPSSGHFVESGRATHVPMHVDAYAVAAFELFDEQPPAPLSFAEAWRDPTATVELIDQLDWRSFAYLESHTGAGLGSLFTNVRALRSTTWFDAYFAALDAKLDAVTGMHGVDKPPTGDLDQIGATFHYAFLYDHHRRPLAHPRPRIDAILGLQLDCGVWDLENPLWLTLDAVYLLSRASRVAGHRRAEVHDSVRRAVEWVVDEVVIPSQRHHWFAGHDMATHNLAATVCLFAEAQMLLSSMVVTTDEPLRQVLDRRPFI